MIRRCKNCAGRITYDIKAAKLVCENCGSKFGVDEYSSDDETIEGSHKLKADIYCCSACGAQIMANGTEASTFCIYCGNPTVIFDRVAEINKPEMIIPFKITKEEAIERIKNSMAKVSYLPKEFKELNVELIRGIYIPYYVVSVEHDASMTFRKTEKRGKHTEVFYYKRSGYGSFPWVTVDASKRLNDEISARLDPYYIKEAEVFDEDYLIGFYSDMADVNEDEAISNARIKIKDLFEDVIRKSLPSNFLEVHITNSYTLMNRRDDSYVFEKPVTAMLPAWFMTVRYNNRPYTILINGQTGKITGGFPINKKPMIITTASIAIITTVVSTIIGKLLLPVFLSSPTMMEVFTYIAAAVGVSILVMLTRAIPKLMRAYKTDKLTKSESLKAFSSNRQEA